MKTLTISELLEPLRYDDERSVKEWCIENNVLIEKIGKYDCVFETEFLLAYERPFIIKLKNKFGKGWEQVYNLYKERNIPALFTLNDVSSAPIAIYNAKANSENKYLKKLEEYERKKKDAA